MSKPSSYSTAQSIFLADLARNLFASNAWLSRSRNWSAFANSKEVVWNQSGAKPGVLINRDSTALTPSKRNDVKRFYELDEYQSLPTTIDWTDEMVINYLKRADIINDHRKQIEADLALRILYRWASGAASLIRTTGAARPASTPNAIGTRKAVTPEDFLKARTELVKQDVNIDEEQPCCLLTADMEAEILNNKELWSSFVSSEGVLVNGRITRLAGFEVFVRSKSVVFNNAATPVAQLPKADDTVAGRVGTTTDNESALFWMPSHVTRAISLSSLFSLIKVHGGVEASATVIGAGDKFYNEGLGIVALVQAHGA